MATTPNRLRVFGLIALMVQEFGIVEGRTRMQKLVYLANLIGWNCLQDFRFHHFGPFSDSLTEAIGEMRNLGWVHEMARPTTGGNVAYEYSVEGGRESMVNSLVSRVDDQILVTKTQGLFHQLENFSSDQLELMASLVFLRTTEHLLGEELISRTHELKPRFTVDEVRDGLRIFGIMGNFVPDLRNH